MGRHARNKEDIAEDFCFACKDGGLLRVCDFKNCLKAYHPGCVQKDPAFLDSDEHWTCNWHSCLICKKSSFFQCFCCPNSVCRACIREAEFVQVKQKTKGFCGSCLKLAILIEEKADADSDGRRVDFKDTETYEFLFKDYWEIVKDKDGLSLVDLHAAHALLKRGQNYREGSDLDMLPEEEKMSDDDYVEESCDDRLPLFADMKVKQYKTKTPIKRFRSKKKTYIGWGSEELIGFLSAIGKDTSKSLTQLDACEMVKEYVQANNLLHPDKKKKIIICDEKLNSLFRKKKLKFHKIYSLLESHLAANIDSDESYEEEDFIARKKNWNVNLEYKVSKKVSEPKRTGHASLVEGNIKLVYLKRSLIVDLLKFPESFDSKVVGCFVRIKNDLKDFYNMPPKAYQLGQVIGIKKTQTTYRMGQLVTDVILSVSNMWKDVQISMLSDDDLEEEECEDLRQLVKKGLLKRPTVAEFEEKVRGVHQDITNHWIVRELVKLDRLIEQANEKGWRRELFEYIDKRELLRMPAERQRLLGEIPQVIVDAEETITETTVLMNDTNGENKAPAATKPQNSNGHALNKCITQVTAKENDSNARNENDCRVTPATLEAEKGKQEDASATARKVLIIDLNDDNGDGCLKMAHNDKNIIDLNDDNDDDGCLKTSNDGKNIEVDTTCNNIICDHEVISKEAAISESQCIWHYVDPQGNEQGPFPMRMLRYWRGNGFFDDNFMVWRTGESREKALLLIDALHLSIT